MWRRSLFSSVANPLEAAFQANILTFGGMDDLHIFFHHSSRRFELLLLVAIAH
jgi:hypothetical protein